MSPSPASTSVSTSFDHSGKKKLRSGADLSSTEFSACVTNERIDVGNMSQRHTIKGSSVRSSHQGGPYIQVELSLRSEVSAISPFVDSLMHLIRRCRWVPGNEGDVEIALREAVANAVIHGNHEDPGKQVYVGCRGGLMKSPSSSGTKDKDLKSAASQTLPPRKILGPVMAADST